MSSLTFSSSVCGRAPLLAFGEQRDEGRALLAGVVEIAPEAAELALVDDRGVVGVVRKTREEALDHLLVLTDEFLDAPARYQHVVGRDAGLSGVEALAEGDPLGGVLHRHAVGDDRRRLAAQLQGDRGQVLGGGAHHVLADAGGAGEQQVVERQLGKGHADVYLA